MPAAERLSTPPPRVTRLQAAQIASPGTPEHVKQMETRRLKAKAMREQRDVEEALTRGQPGNTTGTKRTAASISTENVDRSSRPIASSQRDGRNVGPVSVGKAAGFRPLDEIQPARNFTKYVEYDFSKMTDTKGGFLTADDDPNNKALHSRIDAEGRPEGMTLKEWERQQLLRSLRDQKAGPYEPGLSALNGKDAPQSKTCRECDSLEIDWKWMDVFKCNVCNACKEKYPEKYSLLTKTEAREDYLLTDPELKDEELLPHIERPNPHKSTWNNMMLYLRFQVEEYALGPKKWGSAEALDVEYQRREAEKQRRKESKFRNKLQELKKKTRVEAWRRNRLAGSGNTGFGDDLNRGGKHEHVWGRSLENDEGVGVKTCVECGMDVEELQF